MGSFPFAKKTYEQLQVACTAAEIIIVLTRDLHVAIRTRLGYDVKDKGNRGRFLMEGVPETDLRKGDRLEPSIMLYDTGEGFDNLMFFPIIVTFWRSSLQTFVYHRNPLWDPDIGFTHDLVMAVDWLHTLSLGCFQFFIMRIIHLLFRADAWQTQETTEEGRILLSIGRMQSELTVFYRRQVAKGINITEISDLAPSTFGTALSPSCTLKAAETNHFLPYVDKLITRFWVLLPNPAEYRQAGRSLLRCAELIRKHRYVFPTDAIQENPFPGHRVR